MTTHPRLQEAIDRHRSGDFIAARGLYADIIAVAPDDAVALFRQGLLELQVAAPEAAAGLLERAVAAAPTEARNHVGLGQARQSLGDLAGAAESYRRALVIDPRSGDVYFALGSVLQALGSYADAIAAYERAAPLQADSFAALNNLGNCLQRGGRFDEAAAAYTRALALRPNEAGAMANLGTVLQEIGRTEEAIVLLRAALDLQPTQVAHAVNLGIALCRRRDFAAAARVLRAAVDRDPSSADAAFNLGNALRGLVRPWDAMELYRRALTLRPGFADALINLGNVHREMGEFAAAASCYEAALRANPDSVAAMNNAGCLLRALGRFDEAEDMLRRGLSLDSRNAALYDNLGSVLKDAGDIDAAIDCFRQSLALEPNNAATHSNLVYALSFRSTEPQPILEEALRWNDRFAARLGRGQMPDVRSSPEALSRPDVRSSPEVLSRPDVRSSPEALSRPDVRSSPEVLSRPDLRLEPGAHSSSPAPFGPLPRRLRIGYVSPDFREHCQTLFTTPLFSQHDRGAFEIFCYASVERPDAETRRLATLVDVWRDVRSLHDAALADTIQADGIDILVDLTMHMAKGRPLTFARKPAPIQVAWLAYPGTTGMAAMDYRISDPRLDPDGFDAHYSERTIRLPDSFWCYHPLTTEPDVNPLPALERGYVTLGCLNNPCKLTDVTLRLWSRVMTAVPSSRLLLLAPPGRPGVRMARRLKAAGITQDRVTFVPYRARAEYLKTYHDIDLGLDTFPYNGHTTSLDALWMGVPTITRVGQTSAGRGGLSQLCQVGLPEFAASTDQQFVDIAVEQCRNLPRLAELRQQLRARLEGSPLMDGPRFAHHMESVYRNLWRHHTALGGIATPSADSRHTAGSRKAHL